ncbi:MAG: Spy/CpxP family protein refolding chaperone [Acidobacteriia bacterium]|nr:Spy/CpxP family protein refolding chaperone [Terriglobia bacterium]
MAEPRVKIVGLLVLIFLLGAITGSLGYRLLEEKGALASSTRTAPGASHRGEVVDKFTRELNLTPEQTQRLNAIFAENEQKFSELHKSFKPQADAIRQEGRNRIRAMLTDEQKLKFEDMLRKMDEERRQRGEARRR